MSLPKKGSRVLAIGDKHYRYVIKPMTGKNPEEKELTLIIQSAEDEPGNPVIIPLTNVEIIGGTNNGIGPRDVVQLILHAVANGWDPAKKGPPVHVIQSTRITR